MISVFGNSKVDGNHLCHGHGSTSTAWEQLPGIVDPVANTITVTANGLSPFALGVVPEPSSLVLAAFAFAGLAPWRWRRHRPLG